MRTITSLSQVLPTDVRVENQGDGTWKVYEPGDALPPVAPGTPVTVRTAKQFRDALGPQAWRTVWRRGTREENPDDVAADFTVMLTTASDGLLSSDPNYIAGVNWLHSQGIITADKKAELLA